MLATVVVSVSGVVGGVVILVAVLVHFVETCVYTEQIFDHSDCVLTIEKFSIHVVDFEIFHFPYRQDSSR